MDQTWHGYLRNNGKLILVALATVAMIGLLPHWVSAASTSTTSTTFTSPLPKPPHGPADDGLRAKLDEIIDRDEDNVRLVRGEERGAAECNRGQEDNESSHGVVSLAGR